MFDSEIQNHHRFYLIKKKKKQKNICIRHTTECDRISIHWASIVSIWIEKWERENHFSSRSNKKLNSIKKKNENYFFEIFISVLLVLSNRLSLESFVSNDSINQLSFFFSFFFLNKFSQSPNKWIQTNAIANESISETNKQRKKKRKKE